MASQLLDSRTNFNHIDPYSFNPSAISEERQEYQRSFANRVREIAKIIGIENRVSTQRLDHDPFSGSLAEANYLNALNQQLFFNYFFLLESENIPENLKPQIQDPRLNSDEYISQVVDWMQEYLGATTFSSKMLRPSDRTSIRLFLIMASQPEKFKQAKEFVLAHELSHLFYKHRPRQAEASLLAKYNTISWILSGVIGCTSGVFFNLLGRKKTAISIGLLVALATKVVFGKSLCSNLSKQIEKAADLKAKDYVEGGIYFLHSIQQTRLLNKKNRSSLLDKLSQILQVDKEGSLRLNFFGSHPTETERTTYLSNFLKKT